VRDKKAGRVDSAALEEQWPHSLVLTTRRRHAVAHLAHPTPWERIAWHIGGASDPHMPKRRGERREGKWRADWRRFGRKGAVTKKVRRGVWRPEGREAGRKPKQVQKESRCLGITAPHPSNTPTGEWRRGGGSWSERAWDEGIYTRADCNTGATTPLVRG